MKKIKFTVYLTGVIALLVSMTLLSCGNDDSDDPLGNDKNDNINANTPVEILCEEGESIKPEFVVKRLELPHLQTRGSKVIVHSSKGEVNYTVEWDTELNSQHWTCYEMYADNCTVRTSRYYGNPQYPKDPLLPTTDLIYGSGYDHGHICPSADRLSSKELNYQTFFLTNMQPQRSVFNGSADGPAGIWLNMENAVRNLGRRRSFCDTLYVCKGGTIGRGGTLNDQVLEIWRNGLIVPGYFFVALLRVYKGQYNAIGLLFKHEDNTDAFLGDYAMSIDQLEALTGFDFFCNLPDSREKVIESTYNPSIWGFKKR